MSAGKTIYFIFFRYYAQSEPMEKKTASIKIENIIEWLKFSLLKALSYYISI